MFKLVLEKAEETEIKLPTSAGSWKKQESSRKTSTSALLTIPKPLIVWITIIPGYHLENRLIIDIIRVSLFLEELGIELRIFDLYSGALPPHLPNVMPGRPTV